MIAKTVEIRDVATFIPAMAIKMRPTNEQDRYLFGRAGFGRTPEQQAAYITLVQISGGTGMATCDPYDWNSHTMQAVHAWLIDHFDEIPSGAVVDVEYITGKTSTSKRSESAEVPL